MSKKVSIVIPVYNTVKYLEKCLSSVCNQTYKNLEIICIDDGSFDGSEKIVDRFARKDRRVVAVHKKNGGESSARNKGLQLCTGTYIGFMDCDDWIEPKMYEKLVDILENSDVDMVASGYYIDTDDDSRKAINNFEVRKDVFERHQLMEYVYKRDYYRGVTGYIWCKLYKKEILQDKDGSLILFDEELKIGGDIVYFSQIALNTKNAMYLNEAYYHYYQRQSSTYHSEDEEMWLDMLRTYIQVIDNFEQENIEEEILVWVKRFLVYRAELVADLAYKNKNQEVLSYCQKIMNQYQKEYFNTNSQFAERIKQYHEIINYKV
jgi:glycosyltransferase involved in cell wall biosynthesis